VTTMHAVPKTVALADLELEHSRCVGRVSRGTSSARREVPRERYERTGAEIGAQLGILLTGKGPQGNVMAKMRAARSLSW